MRDRPYVVVNRQADGGLAVRIVDAMSRQHAVNVRADELRHHHSDILAVAGPFPGTYGTGAMRLRQVRREPQPPPPPEYVALANSVDEL